MDSLFQDLRHAVRTLVERRIARPTSTLCALSPRSKVLIPAGLTAIIRHDRQGGCHHLR
jgi:hypothetical protein